MKYINIHTHKPTGQDSIVEVCNLFLQNTDTIENAGLVSVGLHPWHCESIEDSLYKEMQKLENFLQSSKVLMIGECGLDRHTDTTIEQQYPAFIEQLIIAEKHKKPVLIHSVKCYQDMIELRKKLKLSVPFIFHGYTGNAYTTQQLLLHHSYFSFGKQLLENEKIQNSLTLIPTEKLFLETDNNDVAIETIYNKAAHILNIDEETLKAKINKNFTHLFYEK